MRKEKLPPEKDPVKRIRNLNRFINRIYKKCRNLGDKYPFVVYPYAVERFHLKHDKMLPKETNKKAMEELDFVRKVHFFYVKKGIYPIEMFRNINGAVWVDFECGWEEAILIAFRCGLLPTKTPSDYKMEEKYNYFEAYAMVYGTDALDNESF